MKIIVTGCFGFIGFNFIKYIFKNYPNDFNVIGIDNLNNSCSMLNKEMFSDNNFTHIDYICRFFSRFNPRFYFNHIDAWSSRR